MNKFQMIQLSVNVIIVAAVAVLFYFFFCGNPFEKQSTSLEQESTIPVAYVNLDSVLVKYNFAIDANAKLMRKQEDAQRKLETKARTFQYEYEDFQRKIQTNSFLSRERAESEQYRLAAKQQELQELEAKLTQDLFLENQNVNLQLRDSLMNYLEILNADGRFHVILSNTADDNVLWAADQYDITNEVVSGMNARYIRK
jgi:outer membrane protein